MKMKVLITKMNKKQPPLIKYLILFNPMLINEYNQIYVKDYILLDD